MYTRTHTHTQARTHTTKFSGHVVRFFFFRCFLFSSSPFVFRREENYLVHLFFTALVVHRNKHSHRTQSWRHSTDARTYAALLRHVTSTVHLRLNRDTFTTERPHFFFSRGPKVCGHGDASSVTWGGLAREIQQHACYYITRRFQRCTYFWKNARQHAQRQNTHAQWMKITMETVSYTETEWTMHMRTPH